MTQYTCPKCKAENEEGTPFCKICSYNNELEFLENPACPQCYTNYPSGTHFCDIDGCKLIPQNELVPKCSLCGKEYSAGTKFCPEDGSSLMSSANNAFDNSPMRKDHKGYYPKASLGNRFLALLLDGLISLGLSIPAFVFFIMALYQFERYNEGLGILLISLAFLFYLLPLTYNLIKDGLGKGQSFGKRALGLRVIDLEKNTPCTYGKSCYRNIIMLLVNLIPFAGWLIEPIMVLATEDGRRLGDKAAKTQVIDIKK